MDQPKMSPFKQIDPYKGFKKKFENKQDYSEEKIIGV